MSPDPGADLPLSRSSSKLSASSRFLWLIRRGQLRLRVEGECLRLGRKGIKLRSAGVLGKPDSSRVLLHSSAGHKNDAGGVLLWRHRIPSHRYLWGERSVRWFRWILLTTNLLYFVPNLFFLLSLQILLVISQIVQIFSMLL